jgi:hypothetical protein
MAAIAERAIGGLFAGAKPSRLIFFSLLFYRFELAAGMGSVAEGLVGRPPASASPVTFTGLNLNSDWLATCHLTLFHRLFSPYNSNRG